MKHALEQSLFLSSSIDVFFIKLRYVVRTNSAQSADQLAKKKERKRVDLKPAKCFENI